jgi:hypothetical protein
MTAAWPSARLDRIARLRVLAAGLPGATVVETEVDAPFDRVWRWLSDLEHSVPTFDEDVSRLRVVRRVDDPLGGERLRIRTNSTAAGLWIPAILDVHLASGWCWMASRPQLYVVGMAAEPGGDRTRFALLEGLAFDLPRPVKSLARPLLAASRWRHRRHIPRDLAAIRREAGRPARQ